MTKEYLGDSVYAEVVDAGFGPVVRLTTENGYGPDNEIFLEHEVWISLKNYVERWHNQILEQAKNK